MRSTTRRVVLLVGLAAVLAHPHPAIAVVPPCGWEVVDQGTPTIVWANRTQIVRMRLRNTGSDTWSEVSGDHLSYHWLSPTGAVAVEGLRTSFPDAVPPGGEVELDARLLGPPSAGRWVVEWGMVREGVRWFEAPVAGEEVRLPVRVWWWSGVVQVAFTLTTIALLAAVRRWRPRPGSWSWAPLDMLVPLWTWVAVAATVFTLADLIGQVVRPDGVAGVWSGAALLALVTVPVPSRLRPWAALGVAALIGFVAVADLVYLRYFGSVVPLAAFAGIGQLGQVEGSVLALLSRPDALVALPVAGELALALLWPRRGTTPVPRRASIVTVAAAAVAGVLAALPVLGTLRAALADPVASTQVFSESMLVGRWGVLNVHMFDIARTLREWGKDEALPVQEVARVSERMRARAVLARPSPWFGAARGENLLLIQVESLQQWVIGARVQGVEITPFLNSLRQRALYFPYVFDDTEQGRSSDGEFTALNSQYPLTQGAVVFRRERNHFVALPGVLARRGYQTFLAHPFERGFWNRATVHPRFGFERMMFRRELGPGEVIGWGLADGAFFRRISPELAKLHQPFFAMLITLGLHHPFDLFPDRHKVLDVGTLKDSPLGNYIHAMRYFDDSLAELIGDLESSGVLRNTVVALYGDHEAGLGSGSEVRELAGMAGWTPSTNVMLWRVPFFVLLPGGAVAGERPVPGSHVDIAPTLLDLLGVDRPDCFMGSSLLGKRPFPALVRGGSAVGDGLLYVARGDRVPEGGACYAFPTQQPRPRSACDALADAASDQRRLSLTIVEHDLAETVSGGR